MFTGSSIRSVDVDETAPYVRALVDKLVDIDKNRIHSTDDLVVRKAVFGLLELAAQLEERVAALESPEVRWRWADQARDDRDQPTPDQVLLGERS